MFVINKECRAGIAEHLREDNVIDAVVTDPPYGLSKEPDTAEVLRHWLNGDDYKQTGRGFMGKTWDSFVPGPATWREVYRVLKPGGHALVFAGSRTQDLMSMALRLAGFEIRDTAMWLYGSGFPKSLDVSKAVEKTHGIGASRERALKFTAWLRSTGITARQINEATKSNMGNHYLTDKEQPAIATLDMYASFAHLVPTPPPEIMELMQWRTVELENMKRRNVVAAGTPKGKSAGVYGDFAEEEYYYTAPHTDAAKQWDGWGTALKPAYEPVIIARKPLVGTVADNVLQYGTGAINIGGCRIPRVDGDRTEYSVNGDEPSFAGNGVTGGHRERVAYNPDDSGRWPANVLHDGALDGEEWARYFYCAKASKADRNAGLEAFDILSAGDATGGRDEGSAGLNNPRAGTGRTVGNRNPHPTVKPTELMRYLCRLVTPPGGLILDPFTGSGSTGRGAVLEGFNFLGFQWDPDDQGGRMVDIANARILDALTVRTLSDKVNK